MHRHRTTMLGLVAALGLCVSPAFGADFTDAPFIHPGMLHSRADLDFVKAKVQAGEVPWKSAYESFRRSRYAALSWQPKREPDVVRDLNGRWRGARELGDDALAAYAHALQWSLTGNTAHARKVAEILNARSATLRSITGHDAKLLAGITGYKFCNAAEILRHTSSVWAAEDQARFAGMLTNIYYPIIRDFFPRANGNWDASMIVTMLCIGVFCEDREIYSRAKNYYLHGDGHGAVTNYVFANGQCQESSRDQQHTQLGLGFLADACEVAWKQGDDLWSAYRNRLALGYEYTARYNLGLDVPVDGNKPISEEGRGRFRPIYEKVYRHYHNRLGLEMAFTRQVLEKERPEGEDWDHVSWGTLMFAGLPVPKSVALKSPDGRVAVNFDIRSFDTSADCPAYSVSYRGIAVVLPSRIGFELRSGPMKDGFEITKKTVTSVGTSWKPVCGERSTIRDHYNQATVELQETRLPHRRLQVTLRAYDAGAALCCTIPEQPAVHSIEIDKELTEFRLAGDYPSWATYTAQGVYTNVTVSQIRRGCERPLVLKVSDDMYSALAEARCVDYARTKFSPLNEAPHSLVTELGGGVAGTLPLQTPWRVVMVGESPGRLLEQNDLLLNLNQPCAIANTSWIKAGKVIRETTLSTLGAKACIDYGVKHNLQYIEFDAGWYGPEGSDTSDARAVNVNTNRPQGGLDLPDVIRYAAERGVGVILYVNRRELERRLDDLLPLYRQWGVKGIKFGFVNVGSQKWTAWLHEAIRKAAAHELMVDVHDEYRPTGWSRTYPNLMTQEGIRGDEEKQPNELNLVTVFTRMLAGAGDHTICYYDERVDRQSTHAYQLAKAVCIFSPWQFVYWYDRPFLSREISGRESNAKNVLGDEPELEFLDHCPTAWDDTLVLRGEIGEYAVIARRSGANWFIGAMNGETPRALDIRLSFLEPGRKYVAHVYSDDPSVPTRTHVRVSRFAVTSDTTVHLALPARGGQAWRLEPAAAGDRSPEYRR